MLTFSETITNKVSFKFTAREYFLILEKNESETLRLHFIHFKKMDLRFKITN